MGSPPTAPRTAAPVPAGVVQWPAALLCALSVAAGLAVWLGDPFWCLVTACVLLTTGAGLAGLQRRFAMAGGGRDHHKAIGMSIIEKVSIFLLYAAIVWNVGVWATDLARQA